MGSDPGGMKYVVVHHHPEKLILPPRQRELLFSTGNVLAVLESDLYSLQEVLIRPFIRRPLGLVLWGVADRYGVVPGDVGTFEATGWGQCYWLCEGRRPFPGETVLEDGTVHRHVEWRVPDA